MRLIATVTTSLTTGLSQSK